MSVGNQVMMPMDWHPNGAALSSHECALSQIGIRPDMTLDVDRVDGWVLKFYIQDKSKLIDRWHCNAIRAMEVK